MTYVCGQDLIDKFQQDGVVFLENAFVDWIDTAREAIEQNKRSPSWRERTYHPDDGSSPFFQDYCVWNQFDGYRALVKESPMARIAAQLMCSHTSRIFHDHILVKEPGNSVVTPWHQDQPYYLVEGDKSVSFWVALDEVPRDRSVEYVAASHRWGKDFRPMRFDGTDLYLDDNRECVPEINNFRDQFDIRSFAFKSGDAVAFHFRTIHGAPANFSQTRRRALALRWVGDDAHFVTRPGKTSPHYPDLQYTDGQPFGGDTFPIIYSQ